MRFLPETFEPAAVELDLRANNETDAICAVADLLRGNGAVLEFDRFRAEVLEREKISSTASPSGVAFPHARTDAVKEIVIAAGRSRSGICFGSCAHVVNFIVVIGAPKEMVREYLNLVGQLARFFKNHTAREQLMRAASPAEFLATLRAQNA